MGQKVNPISFRMGITEGWRSRWYAGKKNFGNWLVEDHKIRQFIRREFGFAGISRVDIERIGEKIIITLWAARPGLIIGKRGAKVDKMSEDVGALVGAPLFGLNAGIGSRRIDKCQYRHFKSFGQFH